MGFKLLFKNTVLYGVASSVQKLIPLFTIPIITGFLGKDSLKIYDVSLVYAMLLSWLVIMGQDSAAAAYYFDSDDKRQKRHVLSYSFFIQVISLCFFIGVILVFREPLADQIFSGDKVLGHYWMIALLVVPGHICFNYSLVILRWLAKSYEYLGLCVFNTLLSIVSVWVLVKGMEGSIDSVLYSYIIAINLCGLLGLFLIRKHIFVNPFPIQKDLLRKLVIFGLPFALSSFFNQLIPSIDRYFLLKFGFGESLADYGLAVRLGSFISLATGSFAMAFSPFALSIWNQPGAEKKISRIFELVSVGFLLIVPFALIFKTPLIQIFADSSYESSTRLLPFFFFGWVFDMFMFFSMLGIYKSKKAKLALIILFGSVVVSCVLNFFLVPFLGVIGAAFTFTMTKLVLFLANLYFSRHYFRLSINVPLLSASLLVTGFLCYICFRIPQWSYVGLVVITLILSYLYFRRSPEMISLNGLLSKRLGLHREK